MSNYGGKAMAASFRTVRKNTIQIAEEIPENNYGFRAAPDARSVAQTLVHIALGPTFQLYVQTIKADDLTKVNFMEVVQKIGVEEAKARSKAEIVALLGSEGEKFATFLESLSDEFLAESVAMAPGAEPATKSRLEMLLSPKEHEMHHRGQLMVLQRMVGIAPHLTRQREEYMAAAAARQ
jgi:uncharacterized damage-inducible protein DinB